MLVYADNAATTKTSAAAIKSMLYAMEEGFANPSSLHTPGQRAKELLEEARKSVADSLGVLPAEIYFTSGGSESDNQALLTIAEIGKRKGKMHIISTKFEHHAVLHTLQKLERQGFSVTLLDVHENGIVSPEELKAAIREDTAGVSVMYANNEIGTVQPIAEIGEICRAAGVLFHTDAVQAIGHVPVAITGAKVDMLSLSAHKFHGPRGVGVLYVRRGVPLSTLIEGGAQERGKRAGTENLPAIAGMATALAESLANLPENARRVSAMRDRLIAGLSEIPASYLNGDPTHRVPGIVNFCFEGIEGESLLLMLDAKGIAASSGSACTSGSLDPSHVLLALGLPHEVAHGSLRLSLDENNTEADVDAILRAVPEVVAYLRNVSPVWEDLQSGKRKFWFPQSCK